MIATLGNLMITLAAVGAGWSAVGALGRTEGGVLASRHGLKLAAWSLSGAMIILVAGLLSDRFDWVYVASHSERGLAPWLKVTALWSGQEGSLLLWTWLTACAGAWVFARARGRGATGLIGFVVTIQSALLLIWANPFRELPAAMIDGAGLHALLHHWAMSVHPPMVLGAYAALLVPMAALGAGGGDACSARLARDWALFGWLLLTAGIALGAWWSYVQLGWGGYWAWDPVENASLIPWLCGLAQVHALRSDPRSRRSLALSGLTWLACVVGAAITRGGSIASVHAFAAGGGLLPGLGLVMLAPLGVIVAALARGPRGHPMRTPAGAIMDLGTLALLLMAGATLIGTLLPALGAPGGPGLAVTTEYYRRAAVPMGIAAIMLMALAPVMSDVLPRARMIRRGAWTSLFVASAVAAGVLAGVRGWPELAAMGAAGAALAWLGVGAIRSLQGPPNARRLGGRVAHAGMAIAAIGLSVSSALARTERVTVKPGDSVRLGGSLWTLRTVGPIRDTGMPGVEAALDSGGERMFARRRFDPKTLEPIGEVAVRTGWLRDGQAALLGWDEGGSVASLELRERPGVSWIWVGAAMIATGGGLALAARPARDARALTLERNSARVVGA